MSKLTADKMLETTTTSSISSTSATVTSTAGDVLVNSSVSSVLPESPPLLNATRPDGMMAHISPGALMRGSVVFGVLCGLVVLYIAFRTCRLRRNRKTARYNVLSTHDEAAPLHSDEDEETVFDTIGTRR